MPESVLQQRFVPGAPPPAPLSKTQKKKRKAKKPDSPEDSIPLDAPATAPVEKTPDAADAQQDIPTSDNATQFEHQGTSIHEDDALLKPSPIVELVSKRLKATTKKIGRIAIYSATDPDKLNDDQKRTLKTLPTLEAIQKELSEVKKVIEAHESELAHELAVKRTEAEKAEKTRIADAISAAQSAILSKTDHLLNLLQLRTLLANGEIDTSALSLQGAEATAIYSAADALLGSDSNRKQAVIAGFLLDEGDLDGVSYSRIIEITTAALNPPRAPTPEPEQEDAQETEELPVTTNGPSASSQTGPSEPGDVPVGGLPGAVAASSSFHFMQESELEGPFEVEGPEESDLTQDNTMTAPVNGHSEEEAAPPSGPTTDAPAVIDWAADETVEELPSIAGLHAEFGTSGSATPAEQTTSEAPPANGHHSGTPAQERPADDDDGFTQTGRGYRGRGRGGFRGGERGGYRGFRGGDRGTYRGYRGDRGRGGFRGGREYRGDNERREGNRGRGRGRADRGGPPPATPTTPAAP